MIQPKLFVDTITVTGSRTITDKEFIFKCLDDFLLQHNLLGKNLMLNSGHAKGVDQIAEEWAKERGVLIQLFPANWEKFGKAAGMIRNKDMVDNAEYVCGIWNGESRGTKGALDYAKEKNKVVHVYMYD